MPAKPAAKTAKKTTKTAPAPAAAKPSAKLAKPAVAARAAAKAAPKKSAPAKPPVKAAAKPSTKTAPKPAAKPTVKAAPAAAARAVAKPPAKVTPPPVKLTAEMEKYRELLLAERVRLEHELEEIEARTARTADSERATELSSYEDHPADMASETFEREKDLAIAESVESLLDQVNTALEKVDRGTYGVCDACARPIKKARLQALPFATLCLECQGRLEG